MCWHAWLNDPSVLSIAIFRLFRSSRKRVASVAAVRVRRIIDRGRRRKRKTTATRMLPARSCYTVVGIIRATGENTKRAATPPNRPSSNGADRRATPPRSAAAATAGVGRSTLSAVAAAHRHLLRPAGR